MNLGTHPARLAAAVAAVVAATTTTALALTAGSASADEPGRCLQNVNVRENPDAASRIVALCEAGTPVRLGEERDGFVRVDELGGWAARDFVTADEPGQDGAGQDGAGQDGAGPTAADERRPADDAPGAPGAADRSADEQESRAAGSASGSGDGDGDEDAGDGEAGDGDTGGTTRTGTSGLGGLLQRPGN